MRAAVITITFPSLRFEETDWETKTCTPWLERAKLGTENWRVLKKKKRINISGHQWKHNLLLSWPHLCIYSYSIPSGTTARGQADIIGIQCLGFHFLPRCPAHSRMQWKQKVSKQPHSPFVTKLTLDGALTVKTVPVFPVMLPLATKFQDSFVL